MPFTLEDELGLLSSDHLTVDELDGLERNAGVPITGIKANAPLRQLIALGAALLAMRYGREVALQKVRELRPSQIGFSREDDLPSTYQDGLPSVSSRTREADRLIAYFASEPFCWPPDVTRRQKVRDLMLVINSLSSRDARPQSTPKARRR